MKTVGILGGGQLGMMLAEEVNKLGGKAICLDPNPKCSASFVCDSVIVSKYDDLEGLKKLGEASDVLTYEFENVPGEKLKFIRDTYNIPQGIEPLFDSQNRIREKTNAKEHGLTPPRFKAIYNLDDLKAGIEELGLPCVYKTTELGYDGHGQVVIKKLDDIEKVKPFLEGEGILEEFIKYDFETSAILVRSKDKTICFPMGINKHKEGILDLCVVNEELPVFKKIKEAAIKFMESCNYYGILAIEFFVKGDEFYFNEMAPRPHNSGHYTIEGCTTNQYRELAKFLLDMPLEEPKLKSPTIMKNILGFDYENMKKLDKNDNIYVHDYHKEEVREKRKMAHVTFTNLTLSEYDKNYKNLFCKEKVDSMGNYRIYVEKLPKFQVEAKSLQAELNLNLGLNLQNVRTINVYDLFNFSDELLEKSRYQVFGEIVTDNVTDELNLDGKKYIATEYLPGQFDQRASSAIDCCKLIDPKAEINIRSGRIIILDDNTTDEDIEKIKKYVINAVEAREKDLSKLTDMEQAPIIPVKVLEGFRKINHFGRPEFVKKMGLAMNEDDLKCVIEYFREEGRDPWETELRILDTYWSDHCRHTTFNTVLKNIKIENSFMKSEFEESLDLYDNIRKDLKREKKKKCLMDLGTIGGRYLKAIGKLDDMEVSEENNACSIFVDVDVDSNIEKWLLQFKNETHNHPTEIEPFGGASTCLGGAIRDPLSGRAYVYQAMRVTGAGNIYADVKDTLKGKLPQRIISTKAASGYSSYGNQIGLATTHVREIYHDNYVAKRLEVGAVVGAVKAENVRRESPNPGDIILVLGGRTGRDGIGGATGSSKEHTTKSLEVCSSEVQKGNAPEERKISHLFRRPEVTKLIKKSNDFGAGGVSVAIGELADGLDINLDVVPVKYSGLNATEIAISESQERMAVVVEPKDVEEFKKYCHEENIEVTEVAKVTEEKRLVMHYRGREIVNLSRKFIDSAGAVHTAKAKIGSVENKNPFYKNDEPLRDRVLNTLNDNNVTSQKGLIEMFDSTIGASTVLMPFGGKTQRTETQVSCQKLPVLNGFTNTASIMAYGYNPYLAMYSPYHGAEYAIVEAISKVVAAGGKYNKMRFSYQEYFERMNDKESWGKPLAALLGALKMQNEFGLPSIGGKDSMSGTFQNINVPPMLMAFGITTVDARTVISPEFKEAGHKLYLIKHNENANFTPNTDELMDNFEYVNNNIVDGNIISAYALSFGGVVEAAAKMSFGNEIGFEINYDEKELNRYNYGSILVEAKNELPAYKNVILVGSTNDTKTAKFNNEVFTLEELYEANTAKFNKVYKDKGDNKCELMDIKPFDQKPASSGAKKTPVAYFPVFPGTNCDYDTSKQFRRAGAIITTSVFKNLTSDDVFESILEMEKMIDACDIFVLSGGFSAGDEPDGSAKFIANVLNQEKVKAAINRLIARKGLILGICNGFQALVKSGLLPYGKIGELTKESPTLFRNDINRHISQIVSTKLMTNKSPWLAGLELGQIDSIAVSHGEGKFVVSKELAEKLRDDGQIAFLYVDGNGNPTTEAPYNPNGSDYAIEGIVSKDGLILGKMGHSERYEENLFKNISGNKQQNIFQNAVDYFKN